MSETKKILLIQPPLEDFFFTFKRSIPYGLSLIASVLRLNNFQVKILDCLSVSKSKIIDYPPEMEYLKKFYEKEDKSPFALFHSYKRYGYSWEHIANQIQKFQPDIVGISSLFTPYSSNVIKTAGLVKKLLPKTVVIAGGHHPTALPEALLENDSFDFVIRGEGEYSFNDLCLAIKSNKPVKNIEGVCYKNKDNTYHISEPAEVKDPDLFPLPAMDLIKNQYYKRKNGGCAVITTSRGCPFKCSYCCVSTYNSSYRRRSVNSVLKEIEEAVTVYNVRFIDFEDENLSLNKNWFLSLLNGINEKFSDYNLELRAMNGLYPPSLDDEIIDKMKLAGFKTINLSLCSVSINVLQRFNRPDVSSNVKDIIKKAEEKGMDTVCYIIAGAPGQKPIDSINDLVFLAKLNTIIGVSIYYPAPGSLDFRNKSNRKLFPENFSLMRSSAIPVSDTTTRKEALTILRLSRVWNFINLIKTTIGYSPEAKPLADNFSDLLKSNNSDKFEIGKSLVSAFLYDGNIRGIDSNDQVYIHETSTYLISQFLEQLFN